MNTFYALLSLLFISFNLITTMPAMESDEDMHAMELSDRTPHEEYAMKEAERLSRQDGAALVRKLSQMRITEYQKTKELLKPKLIIDIAAFEQKYNVSPAPQEIQELFDGFITKLGADRAYYHLRIFDPKHTYHLNGGAPTAFSMQNCICLPYTDLPHFNQRKTLSYFSACFALAHQAVHVTDDHAFKHLNFISNHPVDPEAYKHLRDEFEKIANTYAMGLLADSRFTVDNLEDRMQAHQINIKGPCYFLAR